MKLLTGILILLTLTHAELSGQSVSETLPDEIDPNSTYLFYLHGGIVQSRGPDAVSPYWGRYEYRTILDTLAREGFDVISEVRPKDTDLLEYAEKVALQIDTLLASDVPPERIVVVGASMGAGIALNVSIRVGNRYVKYAMLGICRRASWDAYLEHYSREETRLCGNFLSIYERSDSYGSCRDYFEERDCRSGFNEVALDMGIGHGFLYKPYEEWVMPLIEWINDR